MNLTVSQINYGFSHGREFYSKVMQEDYTIMMF